METQEGTPVEETTVQEPEATPEASTVAEEEELTLPSDVEEFTLPEKFEGKSAEEIARAYVELEKFKGKPDEPVQSDPVKGTQEPAEGNKYINEYLREGKLSEESYEALEKDGVSKQEVDDRLGYESYKQQKSVDDFVKPIGGIENFTKMDAWTKDNLEVEEINEIAEAMNSSSKLGKQAIIKDLYRRYQEAEGEVTPEEFGVHTNEAQQVATKGYAAEHEFQKDLSDKRYGVDRSYTQAVERKIAATKGEW